ncbi:MAG: GerAB/ArcD/ProY family transporter [Clostridia bacterium]|nr:GerAB/ArcD/ProY family transporter [Clostridia bacterium]
MNKATAFSEKELIFVVVNSIITKLYLIYPKTVISYGKSASIVLTLSIIALGYVFVYTIAFLFNKRGLILNKTTSIIMAITLICISGLFLRSISESINITLLPHISVHLISLFFITGVCIAVYSGLKAIVRSHAVIVPITLAVTVIMLLSNIKHININNIYPVLGDGLSSFTPVLMLSSYFSDFFLVLLISRYIRKNANTKKIILNGFAISSALLLVMISFILLTINESTIIPVYKLAQNIGVGLYTPRLEVIYSFVWFLSFYLNFSFIICMSTNLMSNGKTNKKLIIPLIITVFGISVLPRNTNQLEVSLNALMYIKIAVFYILPISIMLFKRRQKN